MAWIIQATLPGGSSFDGQIVYDSTTIEVPDDLIRYIESIDIVETPKYINKYTGGESKKYRVGNSSGDDMYTEISISLVSKLPRYLFNILFSLANAINQGGMQLYFTDSVVSDLRYSCRWINSADFTESNVLVGNCSIDLISWKKEEYPEIGELTLLQTHTGAGTGGRKTNPDTTRKLFGSIITDTLACLYSYTLIGGITQEDTDSPPFTGTGRVGALDITNRVIVYSDWYGYIFAYKYSEAANLGAVVSVYNQFVNTSVNYTAFDLEEQWMICAVSGRDIACLSYTDDGILAMLSNQDHGYDFLTCCVDTINVIAIMASSTKLVCYTYGSGNVNEVAGALTVTCTKPVVNEAERMGFVGVGGNIYPYTYNANGTGLALGTPYNIGGTVGEISLDIENDLLFAPNSTSKGVDVFEIDWTDGSLTLLDNWTGSEAYIYSSIDTVNKRLLLSYATGMAILSYT